MSLYPPQTRDYFLSFQFSNWYPVFCDSNLSLKSTIIKQLSSEFKQYLNADGVFVPDGSENSTSPAESSLSDDEGDGSSDDEPRQRFAFPELDAQIRECIKEYGAVFPKLNFSSPKDASWILPPSSPLKCTSPADVYLLLKSSDFISHDLDEDILFDGCVPSDGLEQNDYQLELVLRKWYPIDRSRELRCFVRDNRLIGICERDTNFYEFWNEEQTQRSVITSVYNFWSNKIKPKWTFNHDYVLDILLTRDMKRAHIIDFNPYSPKTDALLFTYEELTALASQPGQLPKLKVIDFRNHPAATTNSPAYQHNMVPLDALALSSGKDIEEFASRWREELQKGAVESDEDL